MKFSVALSAITFTATSLLHSVVIDAAESKLHRGARGATIREEERRLMMDDPKGKSGSSKKKVMTRGDALNDFFFDSPPCPECKEERKSEKAAAQYYYIVGVNTILMSHRHLCIIVLTHCSFMLPLLCLMTQFRGTRSSEICISRKAFLGFHTSTL
jgi:hypothetical protein